MAGRLTPGHMRGGHLLRRVRQQHPLPPAVIAGRVERANPHTPDTVQHAVQAGAGRIVELCDDIRSPAPKLLASLAEWEGGEALLIILMLPRSEQHTKRTPIAPTNRTSQPTAPTNNSQQPTAAGPAAVG